MGFVLVGIAFAIGAVASTRRNVRDAGKEPAGPRSPHSSGVIPELAQTTVDAHTYDSRVSAARLAFDSLLRDRMAPFLRAEGFRKQRQTFWIVGDGTFGVLNFQKSAWNTADEVTFYVNLAVGSDRLGGRRAVRRGPPSPAAYAIELRLEELLPEGTEGSWSIVNWTNVDGIASFLESTFAETAIPFLRTFRTDADILDYWAKELSRQPSGGRVQLPKTIRLASEFGRSDLALRAQQIIDAANTPDSV